MSDVLPIIYTLAEAAQKLRLNKNALARLARRTGHCSQAGRTLLFSEGDLLALWEEMRISPSARSEQPVVSSDIEKRAHAFLTQKTRRKIGR